MMLNNDLKIFKNKRVGRESTIVYIRILKSTYMNNYDRNDRLMLYKIFITLNVHILTIGDYFLKRNNNDK